MSGSREKVFNFGLKVSVGKDGVDDFSDLIQSDEVEQFNETTFVSNKNAGSQHRETEKQSVYHCYGLC